MRTGTSSYTCVAHGAANTPCRRSRTQPPCDPGLTCDWARSYCLSTIAAGELCGSGTSACALGTACLVSAGVARCLPLPYTETAVSAAGYIDACALGRVEPFEVTSVQNNRSRAPIPLPFSFRYYDVPQTFFAPATGAWGTFGTARPAGEPLSFETISSRQNLVAPYMLKVRDSMSVWLQMAGSRFCSATVGAAPNRRFAVEWNDFTVGTAGSAVHLTFQVVMHEGSNVIEFFYRQLEPTAGELSRYTDGTLADIGLVGPTGQPRIVHRGPVSTLNGIRFTPRP